jgi:Fur family ferric uptake transcriptional regulator
MKEHVYQTKKRNAILKYIENNKDRHINVDNINNFLLSIGESVNKTTIYRYLKILVDEGKIRKYVIDEKEGACYQCGHRGDGCKYILHLKCTICNKLIHIEVDEYEKLGLEIENSIGFKIDNNKTVLYGICESCQLMEGLK